jgi:hypothetical protein
MNKQLQYDKKCEIIKNLINTKYKKDIFIFEKYSNYTGSFNEIKNFIRIIINNNASITILPDTLWKNIEHNINMKLDILYKDDKTINCIICLNDVSKYGSCNKCSNCYCILCYIELFKTGSGIITCPFCRYSFGIYTPNYMINKCINEIKIKSGI